MSTCPNGYSPLMVWALKKLPGVTRYSLRRKVPKAIGAMTVILVLLVLLVWLVILVTRASLVTQDRILSLIRPYPQDRLV